MQFNVLCDVAFVRFNVHMRGDPFFEEIEYGRFDELQRRFGIRRSLAYELINAGKIKSVAVKKKGARSGIRLIDFGSVREFLRAEPNGE